MPDYKEIFTNAAHNIVLEVLVSTISQKKKKKGK